VKNRNANTTIFVNIWMPKTDMTCVRGREEEKIKLFLYGLVNLKAGGEKG
jgi:hypothetical protein